MSSRYATPTKILAGIAALTCIAYGQEEPAKQPPAATEPAQQAAAADETPAPIKWNSFTIGYSNRRITGSRERFRQYATPPNGLYIHEFELVQPLVDTAKTFGRFVWRGNPDQDEVGEGHATAAATGTTIDARFGRHRWNVLTSPTPLESETRGATIMVNQRLTQDAGAFFAIDSHDHDTNYTGPKASRDTHQRIVALGASGKVGSGYGALTIADEKRSETTNVTPVTMQRRVDAGYSVELAPTFDFDATLGFAKIEQNSLPSSSIRRFGLGATWEWSPTTTCLLDYNWLDRDLGATRNAYVRRRMEIGTKIVSRWRGWNFQAGFQHRESERYRTDRTFVDVPKWNVYSAKITGRLTPQLRMTIRGTWDDLTAGATVQTNDPRRLFWDDQAMGEIKFDGAVGKLVGYASLAHRFRQNKARDTKLNWRTYALGGSYELNERAVMYVEWAQDHFSASGPSDATAPSFDSYFPDENSATTGIDLTLSPKDHFAASFNIFRGANVRGQQLTLNYHRDLAPNHSLELLVAPWQTSDRLAGLTSNNTTSFALRYQVRF